MNNVLINGRTAVHADSNGKLMTVDVCLTKIGKHTVPIPYPNVAQSADADKTASSVLINGQPACTKDSTFSQSKGDEPGNKKGIKSRKKGAEASFLMGSPNVQIEGAPAARALDSMVSNAQNTPPAPLIQPLGMPPIPKMTEQPETQDPAEQPHQVGVAQDGDFSLFQGIDIVDEDEA